MFPNVIRRLRQPRLIIVGHWEEANGRCVATWDKPSLWERIVRLIRDEAVWVAH